MRPLAAGLVLAALTAFTGAATAAPPEEQAWLDRLTARVIEEVAAGEPLTVRVHVPLCDSSIIACGNAKLGDGDNLATNLYWATTPGFGRWFSRKGSAWKRVRAEDPPDPDVLAVHVYRRTVAAPAGWRERGAPKQMPIEIEIFAWRGTAIDRALAAYAADLGDGAAHLVAWVGHNRLMDLEHELAWPAPAAEPTGMIAIACHTAAYMEGHVPAPTRVPLLLTRDYLFANAAPLEATVLAFATGGGYAELRKAAAAAYAGVQKREVRRVAGAFTNPADRRWKGTAK